MSISYVGQGTGTTTATLPTHQVGDLIVAFAFRDGSTTAASLPAGWTNIRDEGANLCAGRLAYKIAASSSETSGTWTSATTLIIQIYRATRTISVGANNSNTGSATTVNYPALTLQNPRSWVCAFAGHTSTNTTLESPPSGMTLRATSVDATDEGAGFDTNGYVNSWASTNVTVGGTAAGYRSYVLEIKESAQVGAATLNGTSSASFGSAASRQSVASFVAAGTASFIGSQPSVNIATRITENGDRRITEAGDVRIAFVPAEGAVSLFGAGGVNARITENGNRRVAEDGQARISSMNAFTAKIVAAGAVSLAGAGTVSFLPKRARVATFALSGAGTATFASTKNATPSASLAGVGTATFKGGSIMGRTALQGTGTVSFVPKASVLARSSFAASGTISFKGGSIMGRVSLAASGTIVFQPRYSVKVSSPLAGLSLASFNGLRSRRGALAIAGAGTTVFGGDAVITTDNVDIYFIDRWYGRAETYVNIGGTWKQVIKIYAHDNGFWKITR